MTPEEYAAHVEHVAAQAPALTGEQLDELADLLGPHADRRAAA